MKNVVDTAFDEGKIKEVARGMNAKGIITEITGLSVYEMEQRLRLELSSDS